MEHNNAGDFWCIVEDIMVPEMETRRGPQENWGITEGKGRNIRNLTDDSEKPVGEWNTMLIEAVENEIKVWLNGVLVNHGYSCTADKGQIALQAEGSEVEFRKLELKSITSITGKQGNQPLVMVGYFPGMLPWFIEMVEGPIKVTFAMELEVVD